MPYVTTTNTVWQDEKTGPDAFSSILDKSLVVFADNLERAKESMLNEIRTGGFTESSIVGQHPGWSGKILAIRAGLVDLVKSRKFAGGLYTINELGRDELRKAGKSPPVFLTAWSENSKSEFTYAIYERMQEGVPILQFAEKMLPSYEHGIKPYHRRKDVEALRDYLNNWLDRTFY